MKICTIGPTYPFRGGIAHYTTLLVKHLRERGHDVRFISYLKQYPKFLYPGNTAMDPSPESSVLKIECDRVLSPINLLSWFKAFQIIHREKPDLLLLQWWTPFWSPMLFFLTRMLQRFHRAPMRTIFLCHHLISPDGGIFDWFLARRILWRGDAFVVMSEEDFALLRRALPWANIKGTTHPPFDILSREPMPREKAREQLKLSSDDPVLLFFGFVRHYKGLRYLIDAMPKIRSQLPAKLLIVGEFWEDERPYREQIRKLGLQDAVQIVNDYISNDQLSKYFCAADAVVMPYLEATQSGVAQLAIGFERPMIATTVGGMPEVIRNGENGLVAPPANSDALAEVIIKLFTENLAETFTQNIRVGKESASWAPLVQLIEDLAEKTATPGTVPLTMQTASPRVF
jgi:glycosyltransferase involved in cell wall biosynthesis